MSYLRTAVRLIGASVLLGFANILDRLGPTPDDPPGEQVGASWVAHWPKELDE